MPTPQQTTSQPTLPETNQPSLPPPAQVPQLDPITASLYQPATRWRLQKSSTSPCTTRNNAFWTISSTTWTATTNRWAWFHTICWTTIQWVCQQLGRQPFCLWGRRHGDQCLTARMEAREWLHHFGWQDPWPLGTSSWMSHSTSCHSTTSSFWSSCNTCPCLWIA